MNFMKRHLLSDYVDDNYLSDDITNYSNNSYEQEMVMCASYNGYLKFLHMYYIPLMITVGLIGNSLSCITFLTTHLRTRSSSYYLAALAIADSGFLTVLLIVHFSFNDVIEIYNIYGWCQCFVYVSTVSSTLSVWLIVAFTVERFIAVQYPLQRPHICTVSRAKIVIIVLTIVALVTQSYIFWIAGIIEVNEEMMCEMIPDYHDFMKIINFIDTVVTLIGPVILIVTMNTMIARKLLRFGKRFQNGLFDDNICTSEHRGIELQKIQIQCGNMQYKTSPQQSQHSKSSNNYIRSKQRTTIASAMLPPTSERNLLSTKNQQNVTKMLLLISSVFILLNLPSYVIRLTVYFAYALWQKTPPEMLWCVQQFAMLLFYTNFSINFLLYAMCGVTFRKCLWQLFRNKFKKITRRPCMPQST